MAFYASSHNASRMESPPFSLNEGGLSTGVLLPVVSQEVMALVHDLKTPLAAQERVLQELHRQPALQADPQVGSLLSGFLQTNRYLMTMVQQLLACGREAPLPGDTTTLLPVNVTDIVQTVVLDLAPLCRSRQMTLTAVTPAKAIPVVLSDPIVLQRILTNLVGNALDHCPPKTQIRIFQTAHRRHIRLVVEDNGPGLHAAPPKTPVTRLSSGHGMGLDIVHTLAAAIQATVTFKSCPPTGTRVVLTLPRSPVSSPADGQPQE